MIVFKQAWDYGRPAHLDPHVRLGKMPLYGLERAMGVDDTLPTTPQFTDFITFDDDGNICHTGVLTNDDECENQTAALRWAETDAGATRILVRNNQGEWDQVIG